MKHLALVLALFASSAFAEQVTTTGYGKTCEAALVNAKTLAIEKVTGTFVLGESSTDGKKYHENIVQYNGGILNSYEVLDTEIGNGCYVRILADVDEKKNNRVFIHQPRNINTGYDEHEQRKRVVANLDNISKAVYATITNVHVSHKTGYVVVDADITLGLQQKWVSDLKSLTKVIDEEGYTSNNAYSNMHGGLVAGIMNSNPLAAVTIAMAGNPPEPKRSEEMMVCFDDVDCRNLGVDFVRIPREPKLTIKGNGRIIYEQYIDIELYKFLSAGQSKSHPFFKSFSRKYNQPTLMLNSERTQQIKVRFRIDDSVAKNITELEIYLK